jgi:hypothetical protein
VYGEPTFGPPAGGERWGEGRWGTSDGEAGAGLPIALRLLLALPPGARVAVGVAVVALAAGLFLVRPAAGLVAAAVLLSLLVPGRWGRRRWPF